MKMKYVQFQTIDIQSRQDRLSFPKLSTCMEPIWLWNNWHHNVPKEYNGPIITERFSIGRRPQVRTLTNHKGRKQSGEPIEPTWSKYI